jgi:hypothetical protein
MDRLWVSVIGAMMAQISDRKATYEVIRRISGQTNILTIPRLYLDITGNHKSALFLSQCVYWSDKMGRPFYKSYKDWEEEIGLSRWDLDKARKECKDIVTTELIKANGAPTLHYDINWKALYEKIEGLANGFASNSQMDLRETDKSLTETTAEITTYICDSQKTLQEKPVPPAKKGNGDNVNKEEYLKSIEQSLMKGMIKNNSDYAKFPPDTILWAQRFCELWNSRPPRDKSVSYWITSCRGLADACGEFGLDLLNELHQVFSDACLSHDGIAPFNVNDPGGLIKTARGFAASKRRGEKYVFSYRGEQKQVRHPMIDV